MTFEEAQCLMQEDRDEDLGDPWHRTGQYGQELPPMYVSFETLHQQLDQADTKQALKEVHDTFYDHPLRHRFTKQEKRDFYTHYGDRMTQVKRLF